MLCPTADLCEKAESIIDLQDTVLVAADPEFISGVVGLVASRLADQYYRPTIVLEMGETESRGSCRSIPDFHITEALDALSDLLVRYGGHAQAAGFTISNDRLVEFRDRINEIGSSQLDEQALTPSIDIDAEIQLADVDWALLDILSELEPTGIENPRPQFLSRGVPVLSHRAVGADKSHLQMWVGDSNTRFNCIAFRQGAWESVLPEHIDLVYKLAINEWGGRQDIQLQVLDIREAVPK